MESRDYLVFGGSYESAGGWSDFICHQDSASGVMDALSEFMETGDYEWLEVVDLSMFEVVCRLVCLCNSSWLIAPPDVTDFRCGPARPTCDDRALARSSGRSERSEESLPWG